MTAVRNDRPANPFIAAAADLFAAVRAGRAEKNSSPVDTIEQSALVPAWMAPDAGVAAGSADQADAAFAFLRGQDPRAAMLALGGAGRVDAKASTAPTMEARGQYGTGRGSMIQLEFNRPMSRAEVEKHLFTDGRVPPQNKRVGEETEDDSERRVGLRPAGPLVGGKAQRWELYMPNSDRGALEKLKAGLEDKLLAAPSSAPAWLPEASREVLATGKIPQPGDLRFPVVKNDFAAPNHGVTVWRDGNAVFRYDEETGSLQAYRDKDDPRMKGFNRSMEIYVLEKGATIDEAREQTRKDFRDYQLDAFVIGVLGNLGWGQVVPNSVVK